MYSIFNSKYLIIAQKIGQGISVIFFLMAVGDLTAQKLFMKRYTTMNGLPNDQVFTICQDGMGFIWFGTAAGLTRYDGHHFMNYSRQDGILNNAIRRIRLFSDGRLWCATDDGVSVYDIRQDTFINYNYTQGIGRGQVWDVIEDKAGNAWIATGQGLSVIYKSDQSIKNFTMADGLPTNVCYALAVDDSNQIYVGSLDGVMVVRLNEKRQLSTNILTQRNGLVNNRVVSLMWSMGNLWAGTPFGLSIIGEGKIRQYTTRQGLAFNSIRGFLHDRQGRFWVATEGGISLFEKQKDDYHITNFYSQHGFGTNQFNTILQDRENNFWFGTFSDGVCKLMSEEFVSFTTDDGLPNNTILSIFPYREKKYLMGTFEGLTVFDGRRFRNYKSENGLISSVIWDIGKDSNGIIWLATYSGLQLLIPKDYFLNRSQWTESHEYKIKRLISHATRMGEFYAVTPPWLSPLHNVSFSDICIDRKNRIWLGSRDKGIFRIDMDSLGNMKISHFSAAQGLQSNNGWKIYEDRQGQIWVGLIGGGLAHYQESRQRFLPLTTENGLPDNTILSIAEDHDGFLWLGSEKGLIRFNTRVLQELTKNPSLRLDKDLMILTTKNNLPDNIVNAIERDDYGLLWVGTNKGLVCFDPIKQKIHAVYTNRNGLIKSDISTHNSLWIEDTTRIFAGTSGGLTIIPFHKKVVNDSTPISVFLNEVLIENKFQKVTRKISWKELFSLTHIEKPSGSVFFRMPSAELQFEESILTFEFISPVYRDENLIQYRYRLLGFEKDWSEPTYENKVRYTNLDDGDYVFEVMARVGDQKWNSKPLSFYFRIQTPFWKSWWFIAFITLMVGFSIYTLYQFRISMIEKRNRDLEAHVQVRTRQLMKEKEKVESILLELKETQTQLVQNEKMASLGQLVAGIAHEINNPITFIKGNIYILERKVEEITRLFNILNDLNTYREKLKEVSDHADDPVISKLNEINQWFKKNNIIKFMDDLPKIILDMKDGVERTRKIVDNLKEFSRSNESDFKDVNIHDNIDSTLNILKSEYKNRIVIHRDYGELPLVYCNPGHINQVLMNLLTNAFQAIPQAGNVWIKTTAGQNNVLISIRDDGTGIPYEIQHQIFDPFFTTKPVGKGTGLGLSISYKIIENHKGTIYFESIPGKGTEFKITLPIRRKDQPGEQRMI